MPTWPGVRRDVTSVGDGLHVAQNVSYQYDGEIGQRAGLTRSTVPLGSAQIQRIWQTRDYLYFTDGIYVTRYDLASLAEGDPETGSSSSYIGTFPNLVSIENVTYLYDGASTTNKVIDGTTAPAAIGIAAPSNITTVITFSGTGNVGIGTHLLRGRRKTTRGPFTVWSNPNAITSGLCGEEGDALVSSADVWPSDTPYTRVVELTAGDGVTFYQTADTDWASTTSPSIYAQADSVLQQSTPSSFIGDYGHEPPPYGDCVAWVRGRVFVGGVAAYPNRIFYSQAGLPESFYATKQYIDMLANGDRLTGLTEHLGDLWAFGSSSADRFVWSTDPAAGEHAEVPGTLGIWNQRCLCRAEGTLFGWGRNGVWAMEGGRQRHISKAVDEIVIDEADTTLDYRYHCVWNPDERCVFFFYVATGDTAPKQAIVLDIDAKAWFTAKWDIGITASCLVRTSGGPRVLLGDEYGKTWFQLGTTDGMETGVSSYQTVLSGTTGTYVYISDPGECIGAMMYCPRLDELVRINDFTGADLCLLAGTFSDSLIEGEPIAVGGIPWEIETKWWHSDSLATRKQPVGLYIEYIPQAIGTAKVEIYRDFSDTLVTFDILDTDTLPDGVSLVSGGLVIDLTGTGFVKVPLELNMARALKAKIISDRLAPAVQILRVAFQPTPHGTERGDMS